MVPLIIYVKVLTIALKLARAYISVVEKMLDSAMTLGDEVVIIQDKASLTKAVSDMKNIAKLLEEEQEVCLIEYY